MNTPTEPPALPPLSGGHNFACHYTAGARQWKWRFADPITPPTPRSLRSAVDMPHDDLDRDKMYTSRADEPDDDGDLELEPLDPELVAAEQRRAAAAIEVHRKAIDVEEVYRDFEANRDSEIIKEWTERLRNFRFQFGTRHLLIGMAAVAILIVLSMWMGLGTVIIVAIMLGVAGLTLLLKLEENKRQEEADHRRQKMYAERRAAQARASGLPVENNEDG